MDQGVEAAANQRATPDAVNRGQRGERIAYPAQGCTRREGRDGGAGELNSVRRTSSWSANPGEVG